MSLGSIATWLYTVYSTPSLARLSLTCCIGNRLSTVGSVTTTTFFDFRFFRSLPTSCVTPGPKRIDDAAISKAYSLDRGPSAGVAYRRFASALLWMKLAGDLLLLWWWLGFEWHGQLGGWVNWMVRRRFDARWAACEGLADDCTYAMGGKEQNVHWGAPLREEAW